MEIMKNNLSNNRFLFSNFNPLTTSSPGGETNSTPFIKSITNPKKKRTTKFLKINPNSQQTPTKPTRKPDQSAPKITRPCTECGKKFWSWKALFGHMRCHPERKWRGINPPPSFRRRLESPPPTFSSAVTEEDYEMAACLLMLANGPITFPTDYQSPSSLIAVNDQLVTEYISDRFDCSSCKKVCGSRQALGGHRATHKNVKGCYTITRNNSIRDEEYGSNNNNNSNNLCCVSGEGGGVGHVCGICFRVFSSGQALGGHMRCHWDPPPTINNRVLSSSSCGGAADFDLNLAAAADDDKILVSQVEVDDHVEDEDEDDIDYDVCSSAGLSLDLRLGF